MCGIAGLFCASEPLPEPELDHALTAMTATLRHRGPDDEGTWADAAAGIGLGHRRLSILDLSPAGHQPMVSSSGRFVLVYNGEVYNFTELRRDLAGRGIGFSGHSDTEVVLAALECWGVSEAVKRFVGMFALALWDCRERTLHLVRDRLGIKPLYYGWCGNRLLFGSELKTLRAAPFWHGEIDRDAVALFMQFGYVPAPYSIYRQVYKLPPGTILSVRDPASSQGACSPTPYWSVAEAARRGAAEPFRGPAAAAVEAAETLLREAVTCRMIADVPLGAFLSGGVDSSAVVALMQSASTRPVRTFTIGFHEQSYDEAGYAQAVARHLGTEHTELYVSPAQAQAVIPGLAETYDEPFADASQIPTCLIAALARREVTVALSGDGGDEVFAGYNRYVQVPRIRRRVGWLPAAARRFLGGAMRLVPLPVYARLFRALDAVLPSELTDRPAGDSVRKLADVIGAASLDDVYRCLISHWQDPAAVVLGIEPGRARSPLTALPADADLDQAVRHMMRMDLSGYHPDDILVKVDRATMRVGLEARLPLIDHRVVEFAQTLPLAYLLRGGRSKWILREILNRYVPPALIERPKKGFAMPVGAWLRGGLRDWAEELLSAPRLRDGGFLDPGPVRRLWAQHCAGTHDWQDRLWDVLMFQAWLDHSAS